MKIDDDLEAVISCPADSLVKVRGLALYVGLAGTDVVGPVTYRNLSFSSWPSAPQDGSLGHG